MGKFNSDGHYISYCGEEHLQKNRVALISQQKSLKCSYWVHLKNNKMISVLFQSKPFSITVIQVYAPTTKTKEFEQFSEDLQDLLELIIIFLKNVLFIIGDWNAKVGSQEIPGITGMFALEHKKKQGKG